MGVDRSARASPASSRSLVGIGALRVRGLLLAISTLAFAIAAQAYLFSRPIFTAGITTIEIPRADLGPLELTHRNRAYYYFVLFVLVLVLLLVGHLKRTGIGRMIVGVRENELAAAAMTVSPARAKLIAFAIGGFIAGLGGVLLGAVNLTFGPAERFFLVEDSFAAHLHRGDRRARQPVGRGRRRAVGRSASPRSGPTTTLVPLFTSSIGLLLILLYIPGGFVQIGYYVRDSLLRWVDRRLGPVDTDEDGHRAAGIAAPRGDARAGVARTPTAACSRPTQLTVRFGGLIAVNDVDVPRDAGRGHRPHRQQRRREVDTAERHRRLRAEHGLGAAARARREPKKAHQRAGSGSGGRSRPPRLYPELTVRDTVQLALEARRRRRSGARCSGCRRSGPSARSTPRPAS